MASGALKQARLAKKELLRAWPVALPSPLFQVYTTCVWCRFMDLDQKATKPFYSQARGKPLVSHERGL